MATDQTSSILRLNLMGTGNDAGSWGTNTNQNLQYVLENAVAGYVSFAMTSTSQAITYSSNSATTDQSRMAMVKVTGSLGSAATLYLPPVPKIYILNNATGYALTISLATAGGGTTALGSTITIPVGSTQTIWTDGATGVYTINAATATTATTATNLSGGTAQAIPYQSASGTTTFLSPTTAGSLLQTNNTGSAPSWIAPSSLTVGNVSGVVAASNGGSGTAGSLTGPLYANGASAYTVATGAQIASNIGSSYVQNANYATFAGSGPGGGTIVTSPATSVAGNDGGWQSFTPVLTGSVSTVTFTYAANSQQGRYLVIGNMVYVQIYIGWTYASATTDQLVINNLPISGSALPSGWGNNYNGFGLLQCSHAVAYGLQLFPVVANGTNKLYFFAPNGTYPLQSSSTSSFNAGVTISSTGYVYGCFSYSTS